MNTVKIEAGKVGRLSAGYHFTENENHILDEISKIDFAAKSVFEFWISHIIRPDKNWRQNAKDQKQLVDAVLRIKDLDSDLHDEIVKIINQ